MEVYQIAVNVGIGQPYNGELIFNFHFISFVGVEWTSSFSYGQLCQMDNYINFNTAKIKHVAFPVVSTSRQQRILQLIENDNSYAFSLQTSKRMIEKLRSMLEIWAAVVLMRLHAMPLAVQDIVEKFFSLPHGPNYVESADNSASSSSSAAKKPSSLFGFLKLNIGHIDKGDTYESVIRTEDEAESSKPPMLRLSVVRGPEGPHGKQEYQVRFCIFCFAFHFQFGTRHYCTLFVRRYLFSIVIVLARQRTMFIVGLVSLPLCTRS